MPPARKQAAARDQKHADDALTLLADAASGDAARPPLLRLAAEEQPAATRLISGGELAATAGKAMRASSGVGHGGLLELSQHGTPRLTSSQLLPAASLLATPNCPPLPFTQQHTPSAGAGASLIHLMAAMATPNPFPASNILPYSTHTPAVAAGCNAERQLKQLLFDADSDNGCGLQRGDMSAGARSGSGGASAAAPTTASTLLAAPGIAAAGTALAAARLIPLFPAATMASSYEGCEANAQRSSWQQQGAKAALQAPAAAGSAAGQQHLQPMQAAAGGSGSGASGDSSLAAAGKPGSGGASNGARTGENQQRHAAAFPLLFHGSPALSLGGLFDYFGSSQPGISASRLAASPFAPVMMAAAATAPGGGSATTPASAACKLQLAPEQQLQAMLLACAAPAGGPTVAHMLSAIAAAVARPEAIQQAAAVMKAAPSNQPSRVPPPGADSCSGPTAVQAQQQEALPVGPATDGSPPAQQDAQEQRTTNKSRNTSRQQRQKQKRPGRHVPASADNLPTAAAIDFQAAAELSAVVATGRLHSSATARASPPPAAATAGGDDGAGLAARAAAAERSTSAALAADADQAQQVTTRPWRRVHKPAWYTTPPPESPAAADADADGAEATGVSAAGDGNRLNVSREVAATSVGGGGSLGPSKRSRNSSLDAAGSGGSGESCDEEDDLLQQAAAHNPGKKEQRKMRNRRAAAESYRRRKAAMEVLEAEEAALRAAVAELARQCAEVEAAVKEERQRQADIRGHAANSSGGGGQPVGGGSVAPNKRARKQSRPTATAT